MPFKFLIFLGVKDGDDEHEVEEPVEDGNETKLREF